jgi:excisionase family DNA binding protein
MDYITAKQAAENWGVSMRWVQNLLKDGRIDGAAKFGRDYMIPADAQKPEDKRKNNGRKPQNKDGVTPGQRVR